MSGPPGGTATTVNDTKQDLLDHVWGDNDAADYNVVQVYVSSLRRKIDAYGEPSLIETVRGVGYRMRSDL
jgi:DNA-binding response OmpR family regulator